MTKKVVVFPGDGIGPEMTREAIKVLKAVRKKVGLEFEILELLAGGISRLDVSVFV